MLRNVIIKLAILLLLCMSMAACGDSLLRGGANEPRDAGGAKPGPVTLRIWHTYSEQENMVFEQQVIPLFEGRYPHIRVQAQFYPSNDQLKSTLLSAAGTDEAPDLMRMDIVWVPEFAKRGILQPVDGMDGFDNIVQSVFPATLATAQYKDKYYGVPLNTNTKVAIYNKKKLEEAGFKEPPTNFEQLIGAAGKWSGQGVYAIGAKCCSAWDILPYFWSFGGQLISPDNSRATGYLDSEESLEAVKKLVGLVDDRVVGPSFLGDQPGTWEGLENGNYMMIDDGPWYYTLFMNFSENGFDVLKNTVPAPFPAGIGGRRSIIGGENLVMFKGAKHPQEAWDFMRFMTTEAPQLIMASTGMLPTNTKAAAALDPSNPPYLRAYLEQINQSLPRPPLPNWSKVEKVFSRYMEKIMRKELPAKDALQEAARQIDALLVEE